MNPLQSFYTGCWLLMIGFIAFQNNDDNYVRAMMKNVNIKVKKLNFFFHFGSKITRLTINWFEFRKNQCSSFWNAGIVATEYIRRKLTISSASSCYQHLYDSRWFQVLDRHWGWYGINLTPAREICTISSLVSVLRGEFDVK